MERLIGLRLWQDKRVSVWSPVTHRVTIFHILETTVEEGREVTSPSSTDRGLSWRVFTVQQTYVCFYNKRLVGMKWEWGSQEFSGFCSINPKVF